MNRPLRRRLAVALLSVLLAAAFAARSAAAQDGGGGSSLLPKPVAEIGSILDLLDAVAAAEARVLADPALDERELAELYALAVAADVIGAQDLAARSRSLIIIARPSVRIDPGAPPALLPPSSAITRATTSLGERVSALVGLGVSSIAMSGVFHALAESNYRRWMAEPDPALAEPLLRSWRGFEFLALALSGTAFASVGVGVPLAVGLAGPPYAGATPAAQPLYTEAERAAELKRLAAERDALLTRLAVLDVKAERRGFITRTSVGVGLIGSVTAVIFYQAAESTYRRYAAAPFSDEAERLGRRVQAFDVVAFTGALAAAGGLTTAIGTRAVTPDRAQIEAQIRMINRRMVDVAASPPVAPATVGAREDE